MSDDVVDELLKHVPLDRRVLDVSPKVIRWPEKTENLSIKAGSARRIVTDGHNSHSVAFDVSFPQS